MIAGHDADWCCGWRRCADGLDLARGAGLVGAAGVVDDAVAATGKGARRAEGKLPPHVMVYFVVACATRRELFEWRLPGAQLAQRLAVVGVHAVQVTAFGCFTSTAACLPFAGQLLSQLGAPYNPRGHNLRRSRPSRQGDQRAHRMITVTVDLVREDY